MLKSLHLENFTVFTDEKFGFGKNLNLIVGENGTGKTHLIKAAYSALSVSAKGKKDTIAATSPEAYLQREIAVKLINVFQSEQLSYLVQDEKENSRCKVSFQFDVLTMNIDFSFDVQSGIDVSIDSVPDEWVDSVPVFFPTHELLSIYRGFVALYDTKELPVEEVWRDTCVLLGANALRGERLTRVQAQLIPLRQAIGGGVSLPMADGFYIHSGTAESGKSTGIPLVAEGFRKLAMVARLIETGALLDKGYLFWDEPEANLDPRMIRLIAKTIMDLSQNGIQIFIATHSLFLMRELYLLQAQSPYDKLDVKCFGLHRRGEAVTVMQGPTIDDIGDIASLDEELSQSERYLDLEAKI